MANDVPPTLAKLGISPSVMETAKAWKDERLGALRPWAGFFKTSNFSRPKNFEEIQKRVNTNLGYYQTNYMIVFVILLLYLLLTNFLLLISMVLISCAYYFIFVRSENQFSLFGKILTRGQAYGLFFALVVVLLYISSIGSSLGWLIILSSVVILGHAALHEEDVSQDFV